MWETNKRKVTEDGLLVLADFYGVSIDYLMGRDMPKWPAEEELIDLNKLLESSVTLTYGDNALTKAEKQRVKDILTTLFWDKLHQKKR